jgi:hypothetical protein
MIAELLTLTDAGHRTEETIDLWRWNKNLD